MTQTQQQIINKEIIQPIYGYKDLPATEEIQEWRKDPVSIMYMAILLMTKQDNQEIDRSPYGFCKAKFEMLWGLPKTARILHGTKRPSKYANIIPTVTESYKHTKHPMF